MTGQLGAAYHPCTSRDAADQRTAITSYWGSAIYAVRGDKEKALQLLRTAFEKGFRDFEHLDASPHFASLRSDPRFQQLVSRYRQ